MFLTSCNREPALLLWILSRAVKEIGRPVAKQTGIR